MSEKPIIFSAEMVRAILAGRKTETRRIVRFLVPGEVTDMPKHDRPFANSPPDEVFWSANHRQPKARRDVVEQHIRCPYGVPGDRLWVREGFVLQCGHEARYSADGNWFGLPADYKYPKYWPVRHDVPGRASPKNCARLWLEVVEVRVERVQGITEAGARAEGADKRLDPHHLAEAVVGVRTCPRPARNYRDGFHQLWDRLNAKRKMLFQWTDDETGEVHSEWVPANYGWDANPWVWVIRFKRSVKP